MVHIITENLYRVRTYSNVSYLIECSTFEELCDYVSNLVVKGYAIKSVSKVDFNGSSLKVKIFTDKVYQCMLNQKKLKERK